METRRTRAGKVIVGGLLAGTLVIGGAGLAMAQGQVGRFSAMPFAGATSGTPVAGQMYSPGPGMMGGQGSGPSVGQVPGQAGYGARGMMGGAPGGMMGGAGSGPSGMMGGTSGTAGMMSGWFGSAPTGPTISLAQAQQDAQTYLDRQGNADLRLDEIMEFQGNFYAIVKEHSTGIGAFEVLINKSTGAVMREPGPDMLWNTKYGMLGTTSPMGQWMGYQPPTGSMTVSADQAKQVALQWLNSNQAGATTEAPDQFSGYYTLHIVHNGKVTGMLSVNGYTGQVWYHTWHGAFIQMKDLAQ